jgi:cell division protein FtsW (lipid II flippase)
MTVASSGTGLRTQARALHRPQVAVWNVGWVCVGAALALSLLGIVAIGTTQPDYALKHAVHLCVGLFAAVVVARPHYRWAQRISMPLMIAVLLLLILVMVPWIPDSIVRPRNGARRWINLQFTVFQPSELAKIAYVLGLASYLRYRSSYRRLRGLLLPLALTFIPMGLVVIEPDLGTAMLFLPTFFAMLVAAGAKLRHILTIIAIGLALAPLMYPLLEDHQKNRIQAMFLQWRGDTSRDHDISFQGRKAMTLVGSGGIAGLGREHAGAVIRYNRLPEEHNDMIFAVIACRWGMLGALGTIGIFGVFCLGGVLVAGQSKDPFGRLVAVGVVAVLFSQMTINAGMTIGLMPITGMTLPFVSSGGSSLVSAWLMVGLLLNIGMRRPQYLARQSFEFDGSNPDFV